MERQAAGWHTADVAGAVDAELAAIARAFDYILAIAPVNGGAAWEEFVASGFSRTPELAYRALEVSPEALRRRLEELPLAAVADGDLAQLFAAKRDEVAQWLRLLELRGTAEFLPMSLARYPPVDDALLQTAGAVLEAIPRRDRVRDPEPHIDGDELGRLAEEELARYRADYPALPTTVQVRDDFQGVMVSGTAVIIGRADRWARIRVEGLLHHEIGTHAISNVNGSLQPLRLLEVGLPGYEETQEGLGVLAEYLAGGLTRARLALIAARVVAARRLTDGWGFPQVFAELHEQIGMHEERAFDVTLRTFRGGGLTKDAIYLRGLARVIDHVAAGGELEPLLVGKLDLADLELIGRLRERGAVQDPPLRAHWLDHPAAPALLEALRGVRALPALAATLTE